MKRRQFLTLSVLGTGGIWLSGGIAWAETFLSLEQAQAVLWGDKPLVPQTVELTPKQMQSIRQASKVRVRYSTLQTWRTAEGGWFILDQVIGKHENIDLAVALTPQGKVKGIEILTYRETYGDEVRHEKWRAQFHGKGHEEHLKLDRQIKNISGATLSCRHITEGINRLAHTWDQVLRHL